MRRLHQQRRGKGSPKYISNQNNAHFKAMYPFNYTMERMNGEVIDIMHNPGKGAPIAEIKLENGTVFYTPASEGSYVGQIIEVGNNAALGLSHIVPLSLVPPGFTVYNLESKAGTGGSFFRTGGAFGLVISKDERGVFVKMKSGVKKSFDPKCLCTLGIVSGAGRKEKPFMKAGNKAHAMHAKGGRIYPVVRGYAMNAYDHPHGGSGHNSAGRQKNKSRIYSAPGQKVGHIAASRTGRRKK